MAPVNVRVVLSWTLRTILLPVPGMFSTQPGRISVVKVVP